MSFIGDPNSTSSARKVTRLLALGVGLATPSAAPTEAPVPPPCFRIPLSGLCGDCPWSSCCRSFRSRHSACALREIWSISPLVNTCLASRAVDTSRSSSSAILY